MGMSDGPIKATIKRSKKNGDMNMEIQMPPAPDFTIPKMEPKLFDSRRAARVDKIVHRLRDSIHGETVGDAVRALETVKADVEAQTFASPQWFPVPAKAKGRKSA